MSVIPMFTPYLDDESKSRITTHVRKQLTLGNSIRSTTVTGIQILNWADKNKETTLHCKLMGIESVNFKTVIKKSGNTKFKGRHFYAIIPNHKRKNVTFYSSKANAEEARSVAQGMTIFIKDHFKLDTSFFCSSELFTTAEEGYWNYKKGHL